MENVKKLKSWGQRNGTANSVIRQDDNGKSWYVRVGDVVSNKIEVPLYDVGDKLYEPKTTVVDLTK